MSDRNFNELLAARWAQGNFVCIGLDPEKSKIPKHLHGPSVEETLFQFCVNIVAATYVLACCYKPNAAFFERFGHEGALALRRTIGFINREAPSVPVIYDAKRADIGNTNQGYLESAFSYYGADAITVHPYLGEEALRPLLDQGDKGIIVLCQTSNPGSGEFQKLSVSVPENEARWLSSVQATPLSGNAHGQFFTTMANHVAYRVAKHWNTNENCGLVVGATFPIELDAIRKIAPDMTFLIPGIGAQGGDIERTVNAGRDKSGSGMIINSSRGIIYASGGVDFAEAARRETEKLHTSINKVRSA